MKFYLTEFKVEFPHSKYKKFDYPQVIEKYNIPIKSITIDNESDDKNTIVNYKCYMSESHIAKVKRIFNLNNMKIVEDLSKKEPFIIFTDGAVYNNGSVVFGSTAVIIFFKGKIIFKESQIINSNIDTNIVEILAILSAIQHLEFNYKHLLNRKLIIHTDSLFSLNLFTLQGYNKRLMERVDEIGSKTDIFLNKNTKKIVNICNYYCDTFDLYFSWIKGHSGKNDSVFNKYNNECDQMCRSIIEKKISLINQHI